MACLLSCLACQFQGLKGERILAKPLLGVGLGDTKGTGIGPRWLGWQSQLWCMGREGSPAWQGRGLLGASGSVPRGLPCSHSSVISSCPGLLYLNLESCRCLPRGLKRAYRGPEEVQGCLEQLLTCPPAPS